MVYELRPVADAADWRALHDIRRAALFTAERHPGIVYDESHPLDRALGNQPFVLVMDGAVIGVVRLDYRGREAVVRLVAVTPDKQRQGHGYALSRLVDETARAHGVGKLLVNAYRGAVGFYERTGWHPEVWDAVELSGIASDCVQMTKSI